MFSGLYTPKLDEKGRLFLPARFREDLGEGVMMTRGQERCLYVFPTAYFEAQAAEMAATAQATKSGRDYSRMLFSSAYAELPDRQGRVTVNPKLRDYAGLDKDCTVIGANTRVEIWDTAAWEAYEAEQADLFSRGSSDGVEGVIGIF